ncbi:XIAP-associated factor 1 [Thalassophryne amazonica]|uniref:XIAP-associated factor 1 n=1 Tax=Thalassophryne amazonica TaxID=390379 RepID=UPI001471F1E7|nr:XIAP-associated factor 1 [Thalassophryne amazonica]
MNEEEGARVCELCHKEVAESNFALHELHCKRFLCLCPDCDEAVPKEQLKQHREDQHTLVRCSKCKKKVERCHLTDHESKECEQRLQSCQFCQLEVPWKKEAEHSLVCGSRTELCGDCGRYVTLKDQLKHNHTCPAMTSDSPLTSGASNNMKITVICRGCSASIPAEDIEEHELECASPSTESLDETEGETKEDEDSDLETEEAAWKAALLSDRDSRDEWDDKEDPNQISTCPYCHLALPVYTLRWHEVKCQIHIHLK